MMDVNTIRHSLRSASIISVMTNTATTAKPMLRKISLRMAKELSQFLYTCGIMFGFGLGTFKFKRNVDFKN